MPVKLLPALTLSRIALMDGPICIDTPGGRDPSNSWTVCLDVVRFGFHPLVLLDFFDK